MQNINPYANNPFSQAAKKESIRTLEELIIAVQSGTVDSVLINASKAAITTIRRIDGITDECH